MKLTLRQRASWLAHLYKATTQHHHRELTPQFARHIPADAVVIDVGAHAGQFTKLFARLASRGRVYALEPSAYARSILHRALAFNHLANVKVVAAGLSDRPGEAVLHTPLKRSTALGFGVAHLGGAGAASDLDQTIELMTLDDFVAREDLARLDFIKADIEGWELRALVGGEATLRRFRPALYLEVDEALMVRAGDTPRDLFRWLTDLSYAAFLTPVLTPAPAWTCVGDYLFVPTDRS
jgi:FkbM family methyltransferase